MWGRQKALLTAFQLATPRPAMPRRPAPLHEKPTEHSNPHRDAWKPLRETPPASTCPAACTPHCTASTPEHTSYLDSSLMMHYLPAFSYPALHQIRASHLHHSWREINDMLAQTTGRHGAERRRPTHARKTRYTVMCRRPGRVQTLRQYISCSDRDRQTGKH